MILTYLLYISLGFLPSLIWLLFYLRKDAHPEPKNQIIQIFVWGMMIGPLAAILEFVLLWLTGPTIGLGKIFSTYAQFSDGWRGLIGLIVIAPAVEEYLKYKIVRTKTLSDSDFDEPLDAMIYLIVGALGFAAIENLLVIFKMSVSPIGEVLGTISIRFVGATFLHALSSGIVGYYLAKSLCETKKRFPLIIQGLALAIVFHGSYNYLIDAAETYKPAIYLIIVLLTAMAIFVSYGFGKLKKELSVCKIT